MLLLPVGRERGGDLPEAHALRLRRARPERRAREAREPRLGVGAERAQARALREGGADTCTPLGLRRALCELPQRDLDGRSALRDDSLHADDPAVTNECDVHGPGRGLRDGDTRWSGDCGTRRRRRLEIDREQAREREQEDDEQDPHRAVPVRCAHGNACKRGADYRRAVRTLTLRELNRATLARQLLLRRHRLSVTQAVERVAGLQAQWPPSPYLGLWSRVEDFRRDDLMRAIVRRHVVKATLMRTTLHLVSCPRTTSRTQGSTVRAGSESSSASSQLLARTPTSRRRASAWRPSRQRAAARVRSFSRLLGRPRLRIEERSPWLAWYGLTAYAALVNGPESSVWRAHTAGGTFVPARTWLGADGASGDDAAGHLVRRYLAAFGPAIRADIAQWTGFARASSTEGWRSSS